MTGNVFLSPYPRDHLFIPDRQATPGAENLVDHAIGNYIAKHRPEVIINIGDQADMPSLSLYDVGKKSFEGRTYRADIEASIHAHEIMFMPVRELQKRQKARKEKIYDPETFICYGNHENRIVRAVENDRKLEGHLSLEDLQYKRFYKHVFPFLEKFIVDGVTYVHYAFKKIPDRAIGGDMIARTILNHEMTSISVGHTPEFHYYEKFRGDGKKIQCMVAGACFDHHEPYAGERNKQYWRGIVHKRAVQDGNYDFDRISLDRLIREYI